MVFFKSRQFLERYFNLWLRIINLKRLVDLFPINFNKPWWNIVVQQKYFAAVVLIGDAISSVFYILMPVFFGYVISQKSFFLFVCLIGGMVFAQICNFLAYGSLCIIQMQAVHGIYYGAHEFFLTVDPIYHILQKRGKILGKIDRSSRSFEYFMDVFRYDFYPIIMGVIAAIITCFLSNFYLGFIALIFAIVMATTNITLQYLSTLTFEQKIIEVEDAIKEVSTENLVQNALIRSSFATNDLDKKLYQRNYEAMIVEGTSWFAFQAVAEVTRLIYLLSVSTLGLFILHLVNLGKMDVIQGTSLLMTYILGTQDIIHIGRSIRYLFRYGMRVSDLFSFIQGFGKQTFPVLAKDVTNITLPSIQKPVPSIEIIAHNITIDYNQGVHVFDGHSFQMNIPLAQENKLYGIIGPSGSGKTTFASLLGGLLKPIAGYVTINGIDLYAIDDNKRREIVAMQGQVASAISGTIKSSLLFGLPTDSHGFSNEELIAILDHVKLWKFLNAKGGLEESIGEGGMNLSGGQRQRLNFANLYLRVKFYKPFLILIDEPTSSLDEVSEKAITTIIGELAKEAVTLVIAHRLKTIHSSAGILDFSLLKSQKEIISYSKDELSEHSKYYRKLTLIPIDPQG